MGEELENFSKQLEIVNTYQLSNKLAYILGILVDKLSLDIRTAIGLMSSCIDMLKQVELDPELELRVLYLLYEGNFGKAREVLREHTNNRQRLGQMNRDRSPVRSFDPPKEPSFSVYQPQTASTRDTFQPQNLSYEAQRQRNVINYGQDRESEPPLQYPKEPTNLSYFNNPDPAKSNTTIIPSFYDHSQYRPPTLAPNPSTTTTASTTSTPSFPSYSQYQIPSLPQEKPNQSSPSAPSIDNYSQNLPSALSPETSNYKSPTLQEFKPPQPSISIPQHLQCGKQPYSSLAHVEPPQGIAIRPISTTPTPQGPVEMSIQKQSSNPQTSSDLKNQSQAGSEASEEKDIPMYESVPLINESRTWGAHEDKQSDKTNKAEENMPKVDFMSNAFLPERGYKEQDRSENITYNPMQVHDSTFKLPSQENPGRNITLSYIAPYDPKMDSERNPESHQDSKYKSPYQFSQGVQGATQDTAPKISNLYQPPISNYSQSIPISPYIPPSKPYSNNPIYPSQAPIHPSLQYNPGSIAQPMHFQPPNMGYNNPAPGSVPQNSSYQLSTPTTTVPTSIPYRGYEATAGSDRSVPLNPAITPIQDFRTPSATTTSIKGFGEFYNVICKLCSTSLHAKPQIQLRCGHSIHKECLKSHVKSPYNNKAVCPIDTCHAAIDESICSSIFESQETSSTPYQPTSKCPKCQATVSSSPSSGVINCSACKSLTCLKCRGSHSPGTNCASSISIIEDLRK